MNYLDSTLFPKVYEEDENSYEYFYDITSKFAKENDCYELVAFTPLDYIARMSRATQKDSSIMYFINYNI